MRDLSGHLVRKQEGLPGATVGAAETGGTTGGAGLSFFDLPNRFMGAKWTLYLYTEIAWQVNLFVAARPQEAGDAGWRAKAGSCLNAESAVLSGADSAAYEASGACRPAELPYHIDSSHWRAPHSTPKSYFLSYFPWVWRRTFGESGIPPGTLIKDALTQISADIPN